MDLLSMPPDEATANGSSPKGISMQHNDATSIHPTTKSRLMSMAHLGSFKKMKKIALLPRSQVVDVKQTLPFGVLHPHAGWRGIWDLLMFMLLIYSALATPYKMSFEASTVDCSSPIFYVEMLFDCLFCLDVLFWCRTAYVNTASTSVSDGPASLQTGSLLMLLHYMDLRNLWKGNGGGFFLLDILGSFPIDALLCASQGSYEFLRAARAPKVFKAVHFVQVLRLMRLARASRIVSKLKDRMAINPGLLALTVFLSVVVLTTHWVACLWFFVGTMMDDDDLLYSLPPEQISWSSRVQLETNYEDPLSGEALSGKIPLYCVRVNGMERLDPSCIEATSLEQYMTSVYWAVTSLCTVGYGDVRSVTAPEYAISIVVMLMGGFCFAYMAGGLAIMLDRVSSNTKAFRDMIYELDVFMHREKLPKKSRRAIREYFTRQGRSRKHLPLLLKGISGSLKAEVYLLLYRDLVRSVPFFKEFSERALVDLIAAFQYAAVPAGETIYAQDEAGDKVYFLRSGQVQMSMASTSNPSAPPTCWWIKAPGFFGEQVVVKSKTPWRLATARAHTWCNIFTLSKGDIEATAKKYPEARATLEVFGESVKGRWRGAIRKVINRNQLARMASMPPKELDTSGNMLATNGGHAPGTGSWGASPADGNNKGRGLLSRLFESVSGSNFGGGVGGNWEGEAGCLPGAAVQDDSVKGEGRELRDEGGAASPQRRKHHLMPLSPVSPPTNSPKKGSSLNPAESAEITPVEGVAHYTRNIQEYPLSHQGYLCTRDVLGVNNHLAEPSLPHASDIMARERMVARLSEWEARCKVQLTLLEEIDFLKRHVERLRVMTGQYASQVHSQEQVIEVLRAKVQELDPDWGVAGTALHTRATDFMPEDSEVF